MWITEDSIAALYTAFIQIEPFASMPFPLAKRVEFVVCNNPDLYGEYQPEPHTITISLGKCSHLDTVIKTLLHEMIHQIIYIKYPTKETYLSHKGEFKRLQHKVAKQFGFDPLEL
jgi:hypothetical protein